MKKEKNFLLAGESYLHTSKLLLDKICENKNEWIVISDKEIQWSEYERRTAYSDFNILVPTLFNLYHGLELLIKGMISLYDEDFDTIHLLDKLFKKLKSLDQSGNEYISILSKYVEMPLGIIFLKDYVQDEEIGSVNELYMSFRYPADKNFLKINEYFHLRYRGAEIISEINEISMDITRLVIGTVKVYRDLIDQSIIKTSVQ